MAEQAEFVDLCDKLGVVFIGPSGEAMRRVGDKIESKRLAEQAGSRWCHGAAARSETSTRPRAAESLGYPLLVKATGGGGSRGIRRVTGPDESRRWRRPGPRPAHAFGDPTVFLEKEITGARHVEIQVIADHHGGGGRSACATARPAAPPEDDRGVVVHPAHPEPEAEIRHQARSSAGRRATPAPGRSSSCTRRAPGAGTSWR